ncbi:MAG: 50S ribosomal protein L13 [Candidatus Saccharimonadales bacterium]
MKTYSAKPTDITRKWYVVDASEAPLGRVATQIATLLLGKGKPTLTKHIDCGDYVIVINAGKVQVSGNKMDRKTYYKHSGFPGGLRETIMRDVVEQDPARVITQAVRGMLPVNKLRPGRLERLKVYAGSEHQHEAQKPEAILVKEGK